MSITSMVSMKINLSLDSRLHLLSTLPGFCNQVHRTGAYAYGFAFCARRALVLPDVAAHCACIFTLKMWGARGCRFAAAGQTTSGNSGDQSKLLTVTDWICLTLLGPAHCCREAAALRGARHASRGGAAAAPRAPGNGSQRETRLDLFDVVRPSFASKRIDLKSREGARGVQGGLRFSSSFYLLR